MKKSIVATFRGSTPPVVVIRRNGDGLGAIATAYTRVMRLPKPQRGKLVTYAT